MAITELALLRLKNTQPLEALSNKETQVHLLSAIQAQASYASYPVYLFTQIEDPSYVYLLGGWDSLSKHMDEWIPSKTNIDLMTSLLDGVDVVWLQHIDIDPAAGATEKVDSRDESMPLDAPVLAIGRYFITAAARNRQCQTTTAEAIKAYVNTNARARALKGGWRLDPVVDDRGEAEDEFVLFGGWDAVEEHVNVVASEGFNEFVQGADIKHAIRWASS